VRKLARRADRVAVIFPFEPAVYAGTGARVAFVGHPLVDQLDELARLEPRAARAALGLDPVAPLVLLLPGSRRNAIDYELPLFLETARALHAADPRLHFALAPAPSLEASHVERVLTRARLPASLRLCLVPGRAREAIRAADVALAKPGTVTVEVMLLGRPLVVAMRGNPLTAALLRRVIHVPSLTMPNLIAGAPVVPEFLQEQARPEAIASAVRLLLEGPVRDAQLARLAALRERLGNGGAAEAAAALAEEMLGAART
jgi:lipid-A-disaccharide synthase